MVRGKITLNNMKTLYEIIRAVYTKDDWDTQFGDGSYATLCKDVSVVFELSDVTVMEFVFLHEIASNVQRISPFKAGVYKEAWGDLYKEEDFSNRLNAIGTPLKHAIAKTHTFNALHNDLLNLSAGFLACDCIAEFTGKQLLLLMGYYSANANTNFDVGDEIWKLAIHKNYIKFFYELSKLVPAQEQFMTLEPSLMEYNAECMEPPMKDLFTGMLASTLYNIMNSYKRMDYYADMVLTLGNSFFKDGKENPVPNPGDTLFYRSSSPIFTLNRPFYEEVKDMPWKEIREKLSHVPEISIESVMQKQTVSIVANMTLYGYIQLLSIIPFSWITCADIPDYRAGTKYIHEICTNPNKVLAHMTPTNYRYRYRDIFISFVQNKLVLPEDNTANIEVRVPRLSNLIYMMMISMEEPVSRVYLDIPVLEAAVLAPSLKASDEKIEYGEVHKIIAKILDTANIVRLLMVPPSK